MDLSNYLLVYGGTVLGSLIGILGGVIGTWYSSRHAKTPDGRRFMVHCAVGVWLGVGVFMAGLLLVPQPYNYLLWIVYVVALVLGIGWMNRHLARLREGDNK
jgi:hypothetical protein